MRYFWLFSKQYVKPYLWWYALGFLCVFLTQLLAVAIINETKNAIDAAVAEGADRATILPFIRHIAGFALLLVLVRTSSRLLIFTPGRMIEYHVRNDYYSRLLFLQRDFLSHHESGDLVSRCTNDITFVRAAYGFGFLQIANVGMTLSLGITAMAKLDGTTTVYLTIPMVISFLIIQVSIFYMFHHWRRSNEEIGALSSLCLAAYKGVPAIQNYHAEPAVERRFSAMNDTYLNTQMVITKNRAFIIPMVQLVGNLSLFLILLLVGPKVIDGRLTIGQVMAFIGYIAMVMPPLLSLGWMLNVFNRAVPAMERLLEILGAEPKLLEPLPLTPWQGEWRLEARRLGFDFPETEKAQQRFNLKAVDFEMFPGKILGIVGPLGSGKTVLLDTLLRLNQLQSGCLFLNGNDAAHLPLETYRRHFSFAPQKALLFSTTLRENLLMSLPSATWQEPETEAKLMKALDFADFQLDPKQFPMGLETQVGEKGVMFSGGQRQRIALARALLKEADIYVLDDVLSAVDHETEKKIIANIRKFAPGKAFIIASHRVSAIQWADEILVLEKGRIQTRGNHEELVSQAGFYRDIYGYQSQNGEGS